MVNVNEIIDNIKIELISLFEKKLLKIYLYGSYVRGDFDNDSDIDIFCLVNMNNQSLTDFENKITDIMVDLSLKYNVVVSINLYSIDNFNRFYKISPYLKNVNDEGLLLYG
ncbi:MAG: nucleotidyltransferase domain-containing protein [Candidatus Absconditabacterales bacterium]|nr:nucleotidyltransferase domain-containing protein [Candidatus Absconditabacterales bacterium]